jgi:rubrerythrin
MDFYTYKSMAPEYRDALEPDIEKAINGEYSAIACYQKLVKAASSDEEKKVIEEIREDEIKHFREFCQIYFTMTGRNYRPRINEKCPADYREGLLAAFKDEQQTVDFYMEIDDSFIAERFRRAASDEQHHAVWFSFFYYNI